MGKIMKKDIELKEMNRELEDQLADILESRYEYLPQFHQDAMYALSDLDGWDGRLNSMAADMLSQDYHMEFTEGQISELYHEALEMLEYPVAKVFPGSESGDGSGKKLAKARNVKKIDWKYAMDLYFQCCAMHTEDYESTVNIFFENDFQDADMIVFPRITYLYFIEGYFEGSPRSEEGPDFDISREVLVGTKKIMTAAAKYFEEKQIEIVPEMELNRINRHSAFLEYLYLGEERAEALVQKLRYNRSRLPDKEKLSELLLKGKGEGRSMAEYAEACDSSPATFSRILRKSIQRPLSEELIRKIVDNAAEHCLNMDDLMQANGMLVLRAVRRPKENKVVSRQGASNMLPLIRSIVHDELYQHDLIPMFMPALPLQNEEFFPASRFGLGLETLAEESIVLHMHRVDPPFWMLVPDMGETQDVQEASSAKDKNGAKDAAEQTGLLKGVMKQIGPFFLKDHWEPETLKNLKVTFVFTKRERYEVVRKALTDGQVKVNGCFSLVLMSTSDKCIVDHYFLPSETGKGAGYPF